MRTTKSYHGKNRRLLLYKTSTLKKDFKKPKNKNRERGFETILRRRKCELRKSKVEGNGRMALEKATTIKESLNTLKWCGGNIQDLGKIEQSFILV